MTYLPVLPTLREPFGIAFLDAMLSKIADFYDDEVDTAVSTLTSLLEPIMIVFLGVVVGGLVVAMYLPIFKLVTLVK